VHAHGYPFFFLPSHLHACHSSTFSLLSLLPSHMHANTHWITESKNESSFTHVVSHLHQKQLIRHCAMVHLSSKRNRFASCLRCFVFWRTWLVQGGGGSVSPLAYDYTTIEWELCLHHSIVRPIIYCHVVIGLLPKMSEEEPKITRFSQSNTGGRISTMKNVPLSTKK